MIAVIGAMEEEIAILKSAMTNINEEKEGAFVFFIGNLDGKKIVLLKCGIGKVNAAVGCAVLIEKYKPSLVLNTGSAGGTGEGLNFGDTVIASGLLYHDVDVTAFNYKPGQVPGFPQIFAISDKLIDAAEKAVDELKREGVLPAGMNHVRGLIGSGDVFMHETGRIDAVRKTFPGIAAVEMESTAIAHTCVLLNVPAIIIRAISDIAGTESPVTHDEFLPVASKHSAAIVRRIIGNYV